MTPNRDDQLADLITDRALDPTLGRPDWTTTQEWTMVEQLAPIEHELQEGAVAPELHQDRTAAMLGLIPDPNTQLDRSALTRLRRGAKLSAGELADRLAARGWDVTHREVFRWENQSVAEVPPALIEAIAATLGVSAPQLTSAPVTCETGLDTNQPTVRALVARLAKSLGITLDLAFSRLNAAASVAVHRGDKPTEDQLLVTLEAYVRAMERRHET